MDALECHPRPSATDATSLFPHNVVRKGQDQFLENARECIANRIHLLAHAPTGLGKTAVSLSAALETTLDEDGFVFFLTSRQSQHSIAVETLKKIWRKRQVNVVDLIGREDMCLSRRKSNGVPCTESEDCYFLHGKTKEALGRILQHPLHVQESIHMCLKMGCCPHIAAMAALRAADIAICDYNQVFGRAESSLIERTDRRGSETVLIVDEGHNLPGRIMENNTGMLTESRIRSGMQSPALKKFSDDLETLFGILQDLTSGANDQMHLSPTELDDMLRSSCGIDSKGLAEDLTDTLDNREYVKNRELIEFLEHWGQFGDASVRFADKKTRRILSKLVDPALISKPVFEEVRCGLIMSATLHPPEMFADLLGLETRFACYHYQSPFPDENRLLLHVGGVSSRFRTRSARTYDAVAKKIMDICSSTPGNVAAFFPSYDFIAKTESFLKDLKIPKRMIFERREYGKNERNAILANLDGEKNALLMAAINGSFSEGVDFKNNLLSTVVIVGFPMNPPSPEAEAMKQRMERKFGRKKANLYVSVYPAVSKVLQAAGRAIRSEHDRAAIVMIDDRYFLPATKSAFPDDFQGIGTNELCHILASFFDRTI
jgi:DNA excision repair protein ERCC-2